MRVESAVVASEPGFASEAQNRRILVALSLLGLLALLAVALWLRWQYVRDVSLNVDEFTTLWAAHRLLDTGLPVMPSGVLYTRGLLTTYATAAFMAVGGDSYQIGRMPSVLFGLGAVVAIFLVARREWNMRVAWLATLGLVLLPEAVIWSGRARFYSQLMLFVLLTLWAAYAALTPRNKSQEVRERYTPLLFALLFILSLIAQEQTILLYPSIGLAVIWWRGWRYLWRPNVLLANLLCIVAMGGRFWLEQVGQPGYFDSLQTYKPYVNFFAGAPDLWLSYNQLFLEAERTPWSIAAALAVAVALSSLVRARGQLKRLPLYHQATLFFTLHFIAVTLIFLLVVGGSWSDPRYVLMLQPIWLLLGAAGANWLLERITFAPVLRWVLTSGLALLVFWSLWPQATKATRHVVEGYDAAFAYVAEHRQPGDIVMSPQPPACAVVLKTPCDYYARERGFEPYAVERNGVLIDRWSGAQVLSDADELAKVVQDSPRVWFVADQERLGTRYQSDYLTVVIEQFHRVFEEQRAVVLLAEGWRETPAQTIAQNVDPPLQVGGLGLTHWTRNAAQPGQQFYLIFYWARLGEIKEQINTSLQVVAADGARITQKDGPPAGGFTTTYDFEHIELPDPKKLTLPADLSPGRYRLDLVAYTVGDNAIDNVPLADPIAVDWFWVGPPPQPPTIPVDATWQNGLVLSGRDALPAQLAPGEAVNVRLVWSTSKVVSDDYTIFVHLLGPDGSIVAQSDRIPEGGFYPTWGWDVGEMVADSYTLALPNTLPPGRYRLVTGLYRASDLVRAIGADGADAVEIANWVVP